MPLETAVDAGALQYSGSGQSLYPHLPAHQQHQNPVAQQWLGKWAESKFNQRSRLRAKAEETRRRLAAKGLGPFGAKDRTTCVPLVAGWRGGAPVDRRGRAVVRATSSSTLVQCSGA